MKNKKSKQKQHFQTLKATVDKNRKGFGFLIFDEKDREDAFVSPEQAEGLFHGDRVEVALSFPSASGKKSDSGHFKKKSQQRQQRPRIQKIKVLEHRFRELIGRFSPVVSKERTGAWVIYEKKRTYIEIWIPHIPPAMKQKLKAGDWVRVQLIYSAHEALKGQIMEIYGADLPASADIAFVSAEFNLLEKHSAQAIEEAAFFTQESLEKEIKKRKDLRDIPFITIDGETARDFDDAVYVEKGKNTYTLWVGIADVSFYVKENSFLDKEAFSRGTSVYFPERAFHMLPSALSENLCSLKPHVPRLALVARMEFDKKGENLHTEVMEACIQSQRRATYEEIQKEWKENKNPNWAYLAHFELYEILKKMRKERGSIDFELPESEVRVSPDGEVVSIKNRSRLDTHRLIEEFMIAANEAVTVWALKKNWPFVFRVHAQPSPLSIEKFRKLASTVGVAIPPKASSHPKNMADLVRKLSGHPAELLLNMSLLRSMKQAVYSAQHGIHYGLASEAYTHFTSPIRRYPDLAVHRLLREMTQNEKPKDLNHLEKKLISICEHCSYRERLATEAERELTKMKQARLMRRHVGDEFNGMIVGMANSGFFVQISDPYVEGMVSIESLQDDDYEFHEERMTIMGQRKKKVYKIGQKMKVKVVRVDLDRFHIDFEFTSLLP